MSSTKSKSLSQVSISRNHQLIIKALSDPNTPALTRSELANITGMRLSGVCGRIAELLTIGTVKVTGTKMDTSTNRQVEVLQLVP